MQILPYLISTILAIVLGQIASHLNKKMPPVVSEEITYKEFFTSLKKDFKFDIIHTLIFVILFNLIIYFLGCNIKSFIYMFLSFSLSIVFSIDMRFQLIPDETHIFIILLSLINMAFDIQNWWKYILGALIGGAIFWIIGLLSLVIFKKEGMGFGDVKLMASLGLLFGIKNILVITLVSFFLGALIGGVMLIVKRKNNDGYIPFGPFIVVAVILLMFVPAEYIINIYVDFCTWLGVKISDVIYRLIMAFYKF